MADTPQTQPLIGLPPDVFNGDRSYSRAFLTQFRFFARLNRRHPDVTYPHRRVKLALSFIHGPLVDNWKRAAYHGLAAIPTGEAWCYVPSGRINPTWIWDRFAEYTRRKSSVSRRRRLGQYAERDQELSLPRDTTTNPEALSEVIQNTGSSARDLSARPSRDPGT
ncbi:hypothetical protein EDB89DRAFT_2078531 [Lactarius sanguifluus]|nr:hypothetical protein EDB89DRAFT_2078531 [Lactarius sanguifluus]